MRATTFPNALAGLLVLLSACSSGPPPSTSPKPAEGEESEFRSQYPSTYQRKQNPPVFIRNATVLTAAGPEMQHASVYFKDGLIVSVGADTTAPADAVVVDGTGKFVTPGIIDDHSHLGVYAAPGTWAESDGNEATSIRSPPTSGPSTASGPRIRRSRSPLPEVSPSFKRCPAQPTSSAGVRRRSG